MNNEKVPELTGNATPLSPQVEFNIRRSTPCGKLFQALLNVQRALLPAKKTKENPHFRSSYADLEAIWEASRELLCENGIVILQAPTTQKDKPWLYTELVHVESEQWIEGDMPILSASATPQAYGSGLTYARRYSVMTLLNIPTADDDGDAASAKPVQTKAKPQPPQRQATGNNKTSAPRTINADERTRLFAIAGEFGWKTPSLKAMLLKRFNFTSSNDIPRPLYDEVIKVIQKGPLQDPPPSDEEEPDFAPPLPDDERFDFEKEGARH